VRRRRNKENKGKKVPTRLIVKAKLHGDATSQCPNKPHPSAPCLQNQDDDCATMLTHRRTMKLGLQNNIQNESNKSEHDDNKLVKK
jgi:hypothetical protein